VIVLSEATACGKPVVATRSGGPESIVTPENGLLVEVGDVAALAGALRTMVEQARERYDAATIRAQFLERYSRPAVVDALEAVYRGVAAG
jgi:glycosyltransferase involved in cell wall biosynthesis